ncbi:MAG TPA: hypothetical protein VFA60_00140 [Terriglobales bacterium]|nr:hypothetical protein [Terriglobales bacterium]
MRESARAAEFRFERPELLERAERIAFVAGVIGVVASIIAVIVAPEAFLRSYLVAYMFCLGVTLGCLAILMVQHVVTAQWGFVVRRILEAGAMNTFFMALFFIPVLIGLPTLFVWARPEIVEGDKHIQRLAQYLNLPAFVGRAILYFVVWCVLAAMLTQWSRQQDEPQLAVFRERYQNLGGIGLLLYGFTMTFAAIDWVMSLDPHWHSTIYGFYFMAGQGLMGFAFALVIAAWLVRYRPLADLISKEHVHDLGKLMFAFLILWAYMAFSQGLIYWSGNLPNEITWYVDRTRGGWESVGLLLIVAHFALPFVLLLSQEFKRDANKIALLALWIIVMRWVDLYWVIMPSFADTRGHMQFSWMNIVAAAALGGLWLAAFFHTLRRHPLVPLHDPMLEQILEKEHDGH